MAEGRCDDWRDIGGGHEPGCPYTPQLGDVLHLHPSGPVGADWEGTYRRLAVAAVLGARQGRRSGEVRDGGRLVGTWRYERPAP